MRKALKDIRKKSVMYVTAITRRNLIRVFWIHS